MTKVCDHSGKIPFNTLAPGFLAHAAEYEEAALRVLRSGWYVLGEEVAAFEREYAAFLDIQHCVGLNSGLDALILAVPHTAYRALTLAEVKKWFTAPGEAVLIDIKAFWDPDQAGAAGFNYWRL